MAITQVSNASAAGIVLGPTTATQDAVPPWAGAGVYVFDDYVIDLTKRAEKFYPLFVVGIHDCSDKRYFCLSARRTDPQLGIVHLVVPRTCSTLVTGQRWSKDGVETEVLAVETPKQDPNEIHFKKPEKIYYLGTAAYPDVVYEYWPIDGVVAIYHSLGTGDIVRLARTQTGLTKFSGTPHKWNLVTLDSFAACMH